MEVGPSPLQGWGQSRALISEWYLYLLLPFSSQQCCGERKGKGGLVGPPWLAVVQDSEVSRGWGKWSLCPGPQNNRGTILQLVKGQG